MPKSSISFQSFDVDFLSNQLEHTGSVIYLNGYLTELGVKSVVVEGHYVDRHYLDDFAGYYVKSFNSPPPSTRRLHFFSLEKKEVETLFARAYTNPNERGRSQKKLQKAYQGFLVRRPLEGARIGRTVLNTYPVSSRRHYTVVRPYQVHLAGLELEVHGLAFQQQDRGAAVCASTALWSALQRVAYVAGHRSTTPIAITTAAKSPYPASHGLLDIQMASALSSLGYIADTFHPVPNLTLFRAMIVSCLQSQLPVILLLTKKEKMTAGIERRGHAIAVTGYSEPMEITEVPSLVKDKAPVKLKSGSLEVIYVHDDNLGSHAHYELFDSTDTDEDGNKKQMLRRGHPSHPSPTYKWWEVDDWVVEGALVPKPVEMRLPVESLFCSLIWLRPLFEKMLPGADFHYEARFASGIEYLENLFKMKLDDSQRQHLHATLALPRFVGILSAFHDDVHLFDSLLDASEVERSQERPSVLGFIAPAFPVHSEAHNKIRDVGKALDVPVITGR